MRYIRPFELNAATPEGVWLLAPDEEAGCAVRLVRGGATAEASQTQDVERFALVLAGDVTLNAVGTTSMAREGELVVIPAGVKAGLGGAENAVWALIEASPPEGASVPQDPTARVVAVDPSRFEGQGFAYQSIVDRTQGARSLRMNVLPARAAPTAHSCLCADVHHHRGADDDRRRQEETGRGCAHIGVLSCRCRSSKLQCQ